MRVLFVVAVVAAALACGAVAQELNKCSGDAQHPDRMTLFRVHGQPDKLQCGPGIKFTNFKTGTNYAVLGVNVENIVEINQEQCNFFFPQGGSFKSLRNNADVAGVTFVPEESFDTAHFHGPLNGAHPKFGTVVMNGCSLIIQRHGNDYYVSHPKDGVTIKKEIGGGRESGSGSVKLAKRAIITPVSKVFKDDMSGLDEHMVRNTHVWGQWVNNNLEVYVGSFRVDPTKVRGDVNSDLRTTTAPDYAKLKKHVPPVLIYDNCFRVVISPASLAAEDNAPAFLQTRFSLRKRRV